MKYLTAQLRNESFLSLGCFLLSTSILLGAVAAHALKNTLEPSLFNTFQIGVHYQQLQSLGILIIGLFLYFKPSHLKIMKIPLYLHIIGLLLFSGNCYIYALTQVKFFVHLVPIGGVSMIIAWFWTAFCWGKQSSSNEI